MVEYRIVTRLSIPDVGILRALYLQLRGYTSSYRVCPPYDSLVSFLLQWAI